LYTVRLGMKKFLPLLFTLLPFLASAQFYNGSNQKFGKNRVQYKDFVWQYYRFKRFNAYFYREGEDLARYVSSEANVILPELEQRLDHNLDRSIDFIVYKSFSDYKQSNIGLAGEDESNIGGTTRIVGNKVFIFSEGTKHKLDRQIQGGVAEIIVNDLLYGGSLGDQFRSSTFLNIPAWYKEGIVSFYSGPLDPIRENTIRDGIISERYDRINHLMGEDARLAGHAMWAYIADVYGEQVIPSILYMTRVSRSVETGFLYVLGLNLETLHKEFISYNKTNYIAEDALRDEPSLRELPIKIKKDRVVTQAKLSPNGFNMAYVTNILGQYRIYVYDIANDKRKKIEKHEHKLLRITDYTYPVIAWHPNGDILAYAVEKKGKLFLNTYSVSQNKTSERELFALDKILAMNFSPDGKTMVFSAVNNGQTDIYHYYFIGNRQQRLTFDKFDDLDPQYTEDGERIIFASNRPSESSAFGKPQETFDIFELSIKNPEKKIQITQTPNENERLPNPYQGDNYSFLSDRKGVVNRFYARRDSAILSVDTVINYRYFTSSYPLTNYKRNILDYAQPAAVGDYSILVRNNGKYNFLVGDTQNDKEVELASISRKNTKNVTKINFSNIDGEGFSKQDSTYIGKTKAGTDTILTYRKESPEYFDFENYRFAEEGEPARKRDEPGNYQIQDNVVDTTSGIQIGALGKTAEGLQIPERRNYNINFTTDYFTTQIDNNFNNQFYQNISGPDFVSPGLSGYFKLGATDLFEDYRIVGGFRLSARLDNNDFMLSYSDLKGRLDKTVYLQRLVQQYALANAVVKVQSHMFNYIMRYPFSEVSSVSLIPTVRYDKAVVQSTDVFSLNAPSPHDVQYGLKGAFIYDKSLKLGLNMYTGTRLKLFAEYYGTGGKDNKSNMQVVGFDVRNYLPIYRSFILATRIAGSTSLGSRRLLYYLGGVDSWLYQPGSENTIPLPDDDRFYYQTIATPLRGFLRNIRNGNSFVLANAELRLQPFKMLARKPLNSDFLETFSIVGFSDIGTAWTGRSPYSEENSFNQITINRNPITVVLNTQEDPIVYSTGFGLRARLFGYFVRADWAFGYIDGVMQPREFYISLSLDF